MTHIDLYQGLQSILQTSQIKKDAPLNMYTYTKLGGKADFLLFTHRAQEIQDIIHYAKQHNIPITILGHGANTIVKDGGIRGFVIYLSNMTSITHHHHMITAQAGASIIDVARYALTHSLTGLEFACGIPGSVGGALYMNAGAYGGEIADVLTGAVVLTQNGELLHLQKEDLQAEYRSSTIAKMKYIVLEATFTLS